MFPSQSFAYVREKIGSAVGESQHCLKQKSDNIKIIMKLYNIFRNELGGRTKAVMELQRRVDSIPSRDQLNTLNLLRSTKCS